MTFPKFVYVTKNTPLFPILHVFAPLNDVRAYIAWSWKTTLITRIFWRAWYPPWYLSARPGVWSNFVCYSCLYLCKLNHGYGRGGALTGVIHMSEQLFWNISLNNILAMMQNNPLNKDFEGFCLKFDPLNRFESEELE